MRKFFLAVFIGLQFGAFAQTKLDDGRLQAIFTDSRNVEIPAILLREIRVASEHEGVPVPIMTKNLIYVQAILNRELTIEERLQLCELAILRFERQSGVFPVSVIKGLQSQIASPVQTRKP